MRHALKAIIWIVFICLLMAVGVFWLFFLPKSSSNLPVTLHVEAADTPSSIAAKLYQLDLIHHPRAFTTLARLSELDRTIRAGDFKINAPLSMWAILNKLQRAEAIEYPITIVEGWTFTQMRAHLQAHPDLKHDTEHWSNEELLQQLGSQYLHPEGLFFPDTYFVPKGSSELSIYRRAFERMQEQLMHAWENRQNDLPYQSPYELLIMASLIEKETGHPNDRGKIAQVFINRLRKNMRLQTDPTVIYGLGDQFSGNLTRKHLRTDTPYNTYTRHGFPPTPIALVSRASLQAATHPTPTNALYFVARGDRTSQFSETLSEHNAAVRKYILKQSN